MFPATALCLETDEKYPEITMVIAGRGRFAVHAPFAAVKKLFEDHGYEILTPGDVAQVKNGTYPKKLPPCPGREP